MGNALPYTPQQIVFLRRSLLAWGKRHFRSFPWRLTTDPYRILIAEIFLHRTQAKQVVPIYRDFIARYPDVHALAQAGREELHAALYSLGLRWRVDLLYEMTQAIRSRHAGEIPREREALLALPGVSQYVAGAVRCFAWNEPEVLMDTNTVRVTGRLLGWEVKDSSRRSKRFRRALEALFDPQEPRTFNYALLDLAHLVCLKKQLPECEWCPLAEWCTYKISVIAEKDQRSRGK
ncbi:MAG: DNA-binding protein [Calditrichaeota bacterium]|nr:MAG: DNA-binding protein [Calditrichota bacterium]